MAVFIGNANSVTFTGRLGTSYTASNGAIIDVPPSDVALACLNGWSQADTSVWPGKGATAGFGAVENEDFVSPVKIAQTGIPFIMAGSGSMGNNGALTLTTALPTGCGGTGAYIYLPANAIVAASAAGWYYCVMSSTTAGTVYNNQYVSTNFSGQPYIPANPVAFATTGPGAFTGVSTAQTAYSFNVPGGLMGQDGVLEITGTFGYTGTTSSKNMTVKLGTATIYSFTTTTAANISTQAFLTVQNQNKTNAQVTNQGGTVGANTAAQVYSSIDTTVTQTLAVSGTKVAADNLVFDAFSAILTPG